MKTFLVSIISFCVVFMALRTQSEAGIVPTLIETTSEAIDNGTLGRFTFKFEVEAFDTDIFIRGVDYSVFTLMGGSSVSGVSSSANEVFGLDGQIYFPIYEGDTESFWFDVFVRHETGSVAQATVESFYWNTEPSLQSEDFHSVSWRSNFIHIEASPAPEPSSALFIAMGGIALVTRRRRG